MPRLNVVQPEQATGAVKQVYADLTAKMGKVVNIFQGLANSPVALRAYLANAAVSSCGRRRPRQ